VIDPNRLNHDEMLTIVDLLYSLNNKRKLDEIAICIAKIIASETNSSEYQVIGPKDADKYQGVFC